MGLCSFPYFFLPVGFSREPNGGFLVSLTSLFDCHCLNPCVYIFHHFVVCVFDFLFGFILGFCEQNLSFKYTNDSRQVILFFLACMLIFFFFLKCLASEKMEGKESGDYFFLLFLLLGFGFCLKIRGEKGTRWKEFSSIFSEAKTKPLRWLNLFPFLLIFNYLFILFSFAKMLFQAFLVYCTDTWISLVKV